MNILRHASGLHCAGRAVATGNRIGWEARFQKSMPWSCQWIPGPTPSATLLEEKTRTVQLALASSLSRRRRVMMRASAGGHLSCRAIESLLLISVASDPPLDYCTSRSWRALERWRLWSCSCPGGSASLASTLIGLGRCASELPCSQFAAAEGRTLPTAAGAAASRLPRPTPAPAVLANGAPPSCPPPPPHTPQVQPRPGARLHDRGGH